MNVRSNVVMFLIRVVVRRSLKTWFEPSVSVSDVGCSTFTGTIAPMIPCASSSGAITVGPQSEKQLQIARCLGPRPWTSSNAAQEKARSVRPEDLCIVSFFPFKPEKLGSHGHYVAFAAATSSSVRLVVVRTAHNSTNICMESGEVRGIVL